MKAFERFFCVIIIVLLIVTAFSACGSKQSSVERDAAVVSNNPDVDASEETPTEPQTPSDPESQSPPDSVDPTPQELTFQERILKGDFTDTTDYRNSDNGIKWVREWVEYTYSDYGISNLEITHVSGGWFDDFSDSFAITPRQYLVRFSSEKAVLGSSLESPGTGIESRDTYIMNILAVIVTETKRVSLSGFLGPEEFDEYYALPAIYKVVSSDPRFAEKLKPLPGISVPEEISVFDVSFISDNRIIISTHMLSDGTLAVICGESSEDSEERAAGILLYDLAANEKIMYKSVGQYRYISTKIEGGKLVVVLGRDADSEFEVMYVDSKGNITTEKHSREKAFFLSYSPDRSKYAYPDKGNLYVADINNQEPRLLIEGNDSDGENRKYYYPYKWLDNSVLVYGIGGYEWSEGCGMVNVVTGENTFLNQGGPHALPIALADGKLYTVTGDMGSPFDPVVIDLKDAELSYRKVFENRDFIEELSNYSFDFSPDGTKIALLKQAASVYDVNTLYICSADNGEILMQYEFKSGFNSAKILDFFDNDRLTIFSVRCAYCPEYMYVVDLR